MRMPMQTSRTIARIAGPALIALGVSEAIHIDIFAGAPAALVYLNGTLLLVGGLAIVAAHARWTLDWTALVTLTGWVLIAGGLYRMFAPEAPQLGAGPVTYAVLAALVAVGAVMSFRGYRRQ